jgi:DNA-binding beta-propeller fold protein YncE
MVSFAVSASVASAATGWTAYVANGGGTSVTPIDTATNMAGTPVPVTTSPDRPDAIAFAPNGQTAYVVGFYGSLTPVAVAAAKAGASMGSADGDSVAIAITPNGQTAYVVNDILGGTVTPFNLATGVKGQDISVGEDPDAIAITPNGQTAYVADYDVDKVTPITLATGATGTKISAGDAPQALAITPNGQTLYVVDNGDPGNGVTPIDIATGKAGTLIPIGENHPEYIAMAPDGQTAYVTDYDGTVTPINTSTNEPGTPITVGGTPGQVAITPDGHTLYISDGGDRVVPVDLASGKAGQPITVGSAASGITVAPDQAPAAAFTATPATAGFATTFSAAGSSSPVGSIVAYHWSFGDGQTATTSAPATTHTYASPNTYNVTLVVTNSQGTSLSQVFTGQSMTLDGGLSASVTHAIVVPAPSPVISQLGQSHRKWRETSRPHSIPLGTTFSFTLNESAQVELVFSCTFKGRRVGHRCVAATSRNRHKRSCKHTVTSRGPVLSGHAGANKFSFTGRLSKSAKLAPGSYTVVLTATAAGKRSKPARLSFTVVK